MSTSVNFLQPEMAKIIWFVLLLSCPGQAKDLFPAANMRIMRQNYLLVLFLAFGIPFSFGLLSNICLPAVDFTSVFPFPS